jgi:hypothetical protein
MSAKVKFYNAVTIFYSICGEWAGLMSGGFSVLFAAFALHYEGHERRMFVFLAFATLWICVFRLAYKNYPKFKLSCSDSITGCATPKNAQTIRFFRMLVETKCINGIEHCSGNLEKIEKDGTVVFEGDATVLPFAKAEDPDCLSKLIKPDNNYWLDILSVYIHHYSEIELRLFTANPTNLPVRHDRVVISTRPHSPANDINGNYIFQQTGTYILYVNVSGKGVPTVKAQLKFNWSGFAKTSTIERIK